MSDSMPENYGQGESGPDADIIPVGNESGSESTTETAGESTGINPSWNEALELLPDEYLRNKVTPVFQKWDENNNKRFTELQTRYQPYQELVDNNVEFDRIKAAFEFQNRVASNPEETFKALAGHLGYDVESFVKAGENNSDPDGIDPDDAEDPRLAELRKTQEGMLNLLAQREYEKQEQARVEQETQWFEETKSELNRLTEKYGEFDKNRVVRESLAIAEQTGKAVDFEAGVRSLAEFARTAFKNSASAKAPGVFSGNGSLASGRLDTKNMSEKEQEDYVVKRLAQLNGGV